MKYHSDYTVKLTTDTKYSSLDKWCLQEIGNEGQQVGPDLRPCGESSYFDVTDLRHIYCLQRDDKDWERFEEKSEKLNKDEKKINVISSNVIFAKLTPQKFKTRRTSYSMVGTNREIRKISLRIMEAKTAYCSAWGTLSYTDEFDFREETEDDNIQFSLWLPTEKFEELSTMINLGVSDKSYFRVSGVRGFYSEWSPEISTDYIKVLPRSKNALKLEVPEGTDIDPPRLNIVSDFELNLVKKSQLEIKDEPKRMSEHYKWAEKMVETSVEGLCYEENLTTNADEINGDLNEQEGFAGYSLNEDRAKRLRRTRLYIILNEMFKEASNYAATNNLTSQDLDELSENIISFSLELRGAFDQDKWGTFNDDPNAVTDRYEREWQLWQYPEIDLQDIKSGNRPYIDHTDLNEAASTYIALPIRNEKTERMLVDAFVSQEIIEFADQMLNVPKVLRRLSRSPLVKDHPLWQFIKGQTANFLIISIIPILILFASINLFDLSESWAFIIGLGFLGLGLLIFLLGVLALPSFWISENRKKREISELLVAMSTVRTEIKAGALVSARHLRKRLEKTSDQGAVWPSAVFPILDDIIDRGGVL